jgi:hypothetical protein
VKTVCSKRRSQDCCHAEAWQRKGSVTTNAAPAYLLCLQSIHQRFHRYRPDTVYLPGPLNVMSDDCSRLWHLSDSQLLAYFNATYPQTTSWRLWHPTPTMLSTVIFALRKTRSASESFLVAPTQRTTPLLSGPPSVSTLASIHTYRAPSNAPTPYSSSKSTGCSLLLAVLSTLNGTDTQPFPAEGARILPYFLCARK